MALIKKVNSAPSNQNFIFFGFGTSSETKPSNYKAEIIKIWQRENYSLLLEPLKKKLSEISFREANWDGEGSEKPNAVAISKAHTMLESFLYSVIEEGKIWLAPIISSDEDGSITIEWHNGVHELHIDISDEGIDYIKVWGTNIQSEMHVNSLDEKEFQALWDWLLDG